MVIDVDVLPKINLNSLVKEFKYLAEFDVQEFVTNSEVIYRKEFDVINLQSKTLVVKNNDKLYLVTYVNESSWIEPLLIQVTPDGDLADIFLDDFISKISVEKLSDCFIGVADYSRLMDLLREEINVNSNYVF